MCVYAEYAKSRRSKYLFADNFSTEWGKGELGELEILQSKGNAHNRYAENKTFHRKNCCKPKTDKNNPYSVADLAERAILLIDDLLAERGQAEFCRVKARSAERNADHRDTTQKPGQRPQKRRGPAKTDQPKNIAEYRHDFTSFYSSMPQNERCAPYYVLTRSNLLGAAKNTVQLSARRFGFLYAPIYGIVFT